MNIYIYIYICKSYVYIYVCVYITIYTYIIYIYRYVCIFVSVFCVDMTTGRGSLHVSNTAWAMVRSLLRADRAGAVWWAPWTIEIPEMVSTNGYPEITTSMGKRKKHCKIYPSKFGFYFGDFVFTKAYESHESPQIGQVCNIWSLYINRCHWSPHFLVDMALSFIQLSIPGMESQSPRTIPEVFGFGVSLATSQSSRSQSAVQFEW